MASSSASSKPAKKAPAKKAPAKKAAEEKSTTAAGSDAEPQKDEVAPVVPRPGALVTRAGRATEPAPAEEPPFDDDFIEAQRQELIKERATYTRQSEVLQAEADSLSENREPGDVQFDEESGEGDSLAVERERDLALSQQALAAVAQIDAALKRIEAGEYGICRESGLRIPRARLEAIPWATERVEYKVGGFGRR